MSGIRRSYYYGHVRTSLIRFSDCLVNPFFELGPSHTFLPMWYTAQIRLHVYVLKTFLLVIFTYGGVFISHTFWAPGSLHGCHI